MQSPLHRPCCQIRQFGAAGQILCLHWLVAMLAVMVWPGQLTDNGLITGGVSQGKCWFSSLISQHGIVCVAERVVSLSAG